MVSVYQKNWRIQRHTSGNMMEGGGVKMASDENHSGNVNGINYGDGILCKVIMETLVMQMRC